MEVLVLDTQYKSMGIIDKFESLIWTDRYNSAGDFELYLPMNMNALDLLKRKRYLWTKESDHVMMIEKISITSNVDTGVHLTVSGRSLESILSRRIVWDQTRVRTKIDAAMKKIITDAMISPKIAERKIPNFVYKDTNDPEIMEISIDKQYSGTNLYDLIVEQYKLYNLGFKVSLSDINQFIFESYKGKDRSYGQFENPYVIFSPNFDNLISSEYFENDEKEKNVTLVAGEDEGLGTGRRTVIIGSGSNLERKELYVDARDLQSEDEEGNPIPDDEYLESLINRGKEKMLDYKMDIAFTGEAETTQRFRYGEDFFMGDIVQVEDGYGHSNKARITELIFSQNESGFSVYPTFEVVEDTEEAT